MISSFASAGEPRRSAAVLVCARFGRQAPSSTTKANTNLRKLMADPQRKRESNTTDDERRFTNERSVAERKHQLELRGARITERLHGEFRQTRRIDQQVH